MNNTVHLQAARLKKVLDKDKGNIEQTALIIKSDVIQLLRNYFDLNENDVKIALEITDEGYALKLVAKSRRIIPFNMLPD